ncbi:MAG TPA: lysophospholipid acyltransferase family protein [Candidatus Binatia bacterium]|nr:lysophospholipid acyltransferase family protein [Candidatus Binatia bacterium]
MSDRIEDAIFRLALVTCGAVSWRWGLRLGAVLGWLFYLVDVRDRRIALKNLAMAFPERSHAEHRRILRATCRNLGRMAFEIAHFPSLTRDNVSRYVQIDDPQRWAEVVNRARERGTIILTGHFGDWELLAYACGLLSQPVTLIHRPMRNRLVDRGIMELRAPAGTQAIPKKAAAKEALRRLKARAMVAIPVDQNQVHSFGVFVDFFGVPACTTTGPARLAMLTRAPIVPVFIVRDGESERHRIIILPDIEPASTGDRDGDIHTTTQRCSAVFEQMVRAHPDHWIWFHKRWKSRPPGEPRLY